MTLHALKDLEASIIFEDTRFIILNKPSGIAVHGCIGTSLGVVEQLRNLRPHAPYLELAHRLDKATSGCLVIAKRKSALRAFQKEQENRGVDKHYLALVQGVWRGGHNKVDAPLLKIKDKSGSWSVEVSEQGKRAVSYFEPIKTDGENTWVRIKITTGRTHQIRVHAVHMGHAIAGDDKYGDVAFNQTMQNRGVNRLALHAESIGFSIPHVGQPYMIQAPLDSVLDSALRLMP